jgi:predicted RNA-binding Zn-ribbon protein involved in translation (DUF1610 family)
VASPNRKLGFLPGWRVFTYVILVINLCFLVWVIAGAAGANGHASDCGSLDQQTCDSARDVGTSIGVGLVFVFWAVVDVILGIIWLVTRSTKRQCPACGNGVKKGLVRCNRCGHDFRYGYQPYAHSR